LSLVSLAKYNPGFKFVMSIGCVLLVRINLSATVPEISVKSNSQGNIVAGGNVIVTFPVVGLG
jgi:hypothetical protein